MAESSYRKLKGTARQSKTMEAAKYVLLEYLSSYKKFIDLHAVTITLPCLLLSYFLIYAATTTMDARINVSPILKPFWSSSQTIPSLYSSLGFCMTA
jgi:hypothetical protein